MDDNFKEFNPPQNEKDLQDLKISCQELSEQKSILEESISNEESKEKNTQNQIVFFFLFLNKRK